MREFEAILKAVRDFGRREQHRVVYLRQLKEDDLSGPSLPVLRDSGADQLRMDRRQVVAMVNKALKLPDPAAFLIGVANAFRANRRPDDAAVALHIAALYMASEIEALLGFRRKLG